MANQYGGIPNAPPNITVSPHLLLKEGFALHQQGKLADAERNYSEVLRLQPGNFNALYFLGVLLLQKGEHRRAIDLIGKAIAIDPNFAEAYGHMGRALRASGRFRESVSHYDRAIALESKNADAHNDRGLVLKDLQLFDEALAAFDMAIALRPAFAAACNNRATVLSELKRHEDALASYDTAIELQPDYADPYSNRAVTLLALRRPEEALETCAKAIALRADYPEAYCNRAIALLDLMRPEDALANCEKAIALKPEFAEAFSNRAVAFYHLKRLKEAITSCDRAIALMPGLASAYWNQSFAFLVAGRFEPGWLLYEWRKRLPVPRGARSLAQPAWLGQEDIAGKTLFIYAEQGLGDTIQFCRYAKLAQKRGAKIIFSVQTVLVRLLGTLSPTIEIVDSKTTPPYFDFHIPLLSMPLAFKTGRNSVPAEGPYLRAESARVQTWKERIGEDGFKVGICWQGDKSTSADVGRSFPLRLFEDLSKIPGLRLISLQKNVGVEQLVNLPSGMKVECLGDDFDAGEDAFVDSAAAMECVDLVITSDTAMAHLAGALGRPVWVALKYMPDWRWLLDGSDSPWYPTMKVFRQPSAGDWASLFAEIKSHLEDQMAITRSQDSVH